MIFPSSKIFIDGGGHQCEGVKKYLKKFNLFHKIYVFEPNPLFHNGYENSNFILEKKAIWTDNARLPFYISKDDRQIASSLLKDKLGKVDSKIIPFSHDEPIYVECIDFSEWLKLNVTHNDDVTLKLDIEGAEYDVLWKMIKDNTIKLIKTLFVEFHIETVPNKKNSHFKLINALKQLEIKYNNWD